MHIRHDHQVAARVGKAVENDENKFSTENDQVLGIIRLFGSLAKHTCRVVFITVEVFFAPGGINVVHACYFILKSGLFRNFDPLTTTVSLRTI